MTSIAEIRSTFLDFFAGRGHAVVPSSPLVPRNDPTLMFANSGMVQFKNLFTGVETRDYARATTAQKCVRAGGKHNDLDNVGYTARHHTFFEMLGNFSFGDYFKDTAIPYAWELVTRELGIDASRLVITVYHDDEEAEAVWRKVGVPRDRIIRIATDDNFWMMGPTGPCGPSSEIFFDHGETYWGGPPGSPEEDGDRFVEIWNLVFMQFEQRADGTREALPKPSIDTGMGIERVAALLQGTNDNYATDLMRALIEASAHATSTDPDGPARTHHRVVADHLRSTSFLIADGVMPSNDGRGYVLRRIMRRAMRHARQAGAGEPLMWRLVPELVRQMGAAYPELVRARPLIEETLRAEETRFRQTLDRGLRLLDEAMAELPEGAELPGETAFKLYDTYGFPVDLTQDALRERERGVDLNAFDAAMEAQRKQARAAWAGTGETQDASVWFDLAERHGATEFLGYDTEEAEGQIVAVLRDFAETDGAAPGEEVVVVVNQTPFYAEAGGQVGDTGTLATDTGRARITDTPQAGRGVRPPRHRGGGPDRARTRGEARGRPRPACGDPGEPLRDPSAPRGAPATAGRACGPARLAQRARPAALRLRPRPGVVGAGPAGGGGRGERPCPARGARGDPDHDPPTTPGPWGPRPCSGRSTATRCAWSRWGGRAAPGRGRTERPTRSSCAAARMSARRTRSASSSPWGTPPPRPGSGGSRP